MSDTLRLFSIRLKLDPKDKIENMYIKMFKEMSAQKRNKYIRKILRELAEIPSETIDSSKNAPNKSKKKEAEIKCKSPASRTIIQALLMKKKERFQNQKI